MESSKPQKPLTPRDKKNHTEKLKGDDIDGKMLIVKAQSPLLRESKTMNMSVDLNRDSFEPIKEESSISVSQAKISDNKLV